MLALYTPSNSYGHNYNQLAAMSSSQDALERLQGFIVAPASNPAIADFDVVVDSRSDGGVGTDFDNRLVVVHGGTFQIINDAANVAGSVYATSNVGADLARRIAATTFPAVVGGSTLGKARDVQALTQRLIAKLQTKVAAERSSPSSVSPSSVSTSSPPKSPTGLSNLTKTVLAVGAGVVVIGGIAFAVLRRR